MSKRIPKVEPTLAPVPQTERYLRVKAQLADPKINTLEKNKRSKTKTICLNPDHPELRPILT